MNKNLIKTAVLILIFSFLCGCARDDFMDLYSFSERFRFQDISPESFYSQKNKEGNFVYYTFFGNENKKIMLKLFSTNENIIDEVRIYLPKYDENAYKKTLTAEEISLFTKAVISSLEAYAGFKDEAEASAEEMFLFEMKTYKDEGELSKRISNYLLTYRSTALGCEFIINNTYLKDFPDYEKPESRPLYGDTTKIRTETVPTK